MRSILIIGQSNMAGRGFKAEVEPIVNDKLWVLRNGRWWKMYVPVNPDRVTAGINLVESFADLYANATGENVGIIPCADGGTSLEQWAVGGVLFDHACYMSELAKRSSEIVAVLWHQGESDCSPERAPVYEERLTEIISALRKKIGLEEVPFIVGGLGDYLKYTTRSDRFGLYYKDINAALMRVAEKGYKIGFASAEGLGANPDNLHFSAAALREFGVRYYNEFLRLSGDISASDSTVGAESFIKSDIEAL